jgi:hypothetical protein
MGVNVDVTLGNAPEFTEYLHNLLRTYRLPEDLGLTSMLKMHLNIKVATENHRVVSLPSNPLMDFLSLWIRTGLQPKHRH